MRLLRAKRLTSRFFASMLFALGVAAIQAPPLYADLVTINFESLSDLESVTNQFDAQGLTFQNTIALQTLAAGGSLNEIDFPPFSGATVVSDDGGPISILFSSRLLWVSGYFTYNEPITMSAYGSGGNLLGSVSSRAACAGGNYGSLGDLNCTPNELFSLASVGDIYGVAIWGSASGGSYVLDDLAFETGGAAAVPESDSVALLVTCSVVLGWAFRRNLRPRRHPKHG